MAFSVFFFCVPNQRDQWLGAAVVGWARKKKKEAGEGASAQEMRA